MHSQDRHQVDISMEEQRLKVIAEFVALHLEREHERAAAHGWEGMAAAPTADRIETMLRAGFWASLRREEGRSPRISIAYLSPDEARTKLMLEKPMDLSSEVLSRLAPAVERPGIHLGVWPDGDGLSLWGATRTIPALCLVLEVVEPGLLVLKHQRPEGLGKFANVAVLQGEIVRIVSESHGTLVAGVGAERVLRWSESEDGVTGNDLLIQLGASMRAHARGGTLLIVPRDDDSWRESIVQPISYSISPAYTRIRDLLREEPDERGRAVWTEALRQTIEGIAGLTAVDGATVLTDQFEVLAFGAKIGRRDGMRAVEEIVVMEPVVNTEPDFLHPLQIGGTRHLSAAQFVHDQHDALALVASQDGRFTTFAWLEEPGMVCANRVEVLLF